MASSTSSSPFTELMMAFPQYTRRALSSTSGRVESSWRGASVTPWRALTTFTIMAASSISGRPTFTSRISAPAWVCSRAWPSM